MSYIVCIYILYACKDQQNEISIINYLPSINKSHHHPTPSWFPTTALHRQSAGGG